MDFLTPDDDQTPDKRQQLMDYLSSKYGQDKQDAEQFQSDAQLGNALAQAGSRIGAAIGGVKYDPNQAFYDAQNKQAAQPLADVQNDRKQAVENYLTGQQMKKDQMAEDESKALRDPTSARAQVSQALIKKYMPDQDVSQLGAKDAEPLATEVEKAHSLDSQDQLHQDNAAFRRDQMAISRQNHQDVVDQRNDKRVQDGLSKLQKDLDPDAGRTGNFGQVSARLLQAQNLKALGQQTLGNPDQRQMEELAIGVNKLLSGSSSPAATQVKSLIPQTFQGDMNKFREWLSNNPTGTGQQAFVQRLMDTIGREEGVARGQLNQIRKSRLGAYDWLKKAAPDDYQRVLDDHGMGQPAPQSPVSAHPPGTIVNVRGQRYQVGADGDTLTPVGSAGASGSF